MTSPASVSNRTELFTRLSAAVEANDFGDARQLATELLSHSPDNGKAWHWLGWSCLTLNDPDAGLAALEKAVGILPEDEEAFDHLGAAYNMLGRFDEATRAFERSLKLAPDRGYTWMNAAKNQRDRNDLAGAEISYRRAIAALPDLSMPYINLCVLLQELDRPEEALEFAKEGVRRSGPSPWPYLHMGHAHRMLGELDLAAAAYRQATIIDPSVADAWLSLALVEHLSKRHDDALEAAERAWALAPDDPGTLNALGSLYSYKRRFDDAIRLLRRSAELQPNEPMVWYNLGNAEALLDDKIRCFQKAVDLDPGYERALSNLILHLNYSAQTTPEAQLDMAKRYGACLAERVQAASAWSNDKTRDRRLRVGLMSPDFRVHPVAYFLEAPLQALQGKSLDLVAYSCVETDDDTTATLKPLFSAWHDVRTLSDQALIDRIRQDRIDILIDLAGHTAGHRLPVFAAKPAPIQVSWLGYVGSTGLSSIDYILGDPWVFPEGQPTHTVETPWRLAESYMCFSTPPFSLETGDPPYFRQGHITFGCFNNFWKVNDQVLALWARLLTRIPTARLFLRDKQLDRPEMRARVLEKMRAEGIAPARIDLVGAMPSRLDSVACYQTIDIALDPFPYTGATSSVEALWMGVPVLTLKGDRFIARVGESFNHNLGLTDWIADSPDDYIERAVRFAADPEHLRLLRRTLRNTGAASPLGNPVWFASQFENALRGMWVRYCAA